MDYDSKDCYRLNLNDYYPQQRNYNSVVYVHKRVAEKDQKARKEKQKREKEPKEKKSKKKGKYVKCDKYQQYNGQAAPLELNNEMISAISSQVTKNIMPVLIPSGGTDSPVYYTIKASKKPKNKVDASTLVHDITYKKERSKKIVETYRANQKESFSVKETISYSSNNDTLDELHVNPSLCCTFSDASEQKKVFVKKEKRERDQTKRSSQKLLPSESFEALATEFLNMAGESKIKIHLMNETEKDLLAENIRLPLLRAIKDCVAELNVKTDLDSELVTVSKIVMSNSSKLDYVAQKLTNLEEKVDQIIKETEKVKAKPTPRLQLPLPVKASTSDELAQNLENASGDSSGDEFLKTLEARKRIRALAAGKKIERKSIDNEMGENLGGGETAIDPDQSVQPDRPNRIPARFCWTDAGARMNTKTQ